MRTFKASIKGVTPLLPNRYVEEIEIIEAIGAKPRDKSKEDSWRQREALLRFHENGHGPFMPGRNIRSAMIEGANATGMKHKMGRTSSKLGPFLRRGIIVRPEELLYPKDMVKSLEKARASGNGFPLHRDVVRIPPVTGALVVKYWPKLVDWSFEFEMDVFDDSLESENELRASLEAAGIFCGLGTGRPDFGKFQCENWTEVG